MNSKYIVKEVGIFITTLLFSYVSHKIGSYDIIMTYLLVRIWVLEIEKEHKDE